MLKYIIKDMAAAISYLPCGIVAGIVLMLVLSVINDRRVRKQRTSFSVPAVTVLLMYMFIILCITFLNRENGSRNGIDMELFSTWGINDRNNAYVVENVLLFVPYGILIPWAMSRFRSFRSCLWLGVQTSLVIEGMQLLTARGYFQIDDILTNTLGTVLGYGIFWLLHSLRHK